MVFWKLSSLISAGHSSRGTHPGPQRKERRSITPQEKHSPRSPGSKLPSSFFILPCKSWGRQQDRFRCTACASSAHTVCSVGSLDETRKWSKNPFYCFLSLTCILGQGAFLLSIRFTTHTVGVIIKPSCQCGYESVSDNEQWAHVPSCLSSRKWPVLPLGCCPWKVKCLDWKNRYSSLQISTLILISLVTLYHL